jgi:type IV secretion system protein VirB9
VSALAAVAWLPSGCAALAGLDASSTDIAPPPAAVERKAGERSDAELVIVEPLGTAGVSTEIPYLAAVATQPERAVPPRSGQSGRAAIAIANQAARAPSRTDGFVGGVQVFSWSLGRVFEVWTAPLRVTTLTLGEGEVLVSKAAGDTVRWQIGETTSGAGAARRTHVLLKPLERGLETNLVLTTNRRVYLLDLRSGAAEAFNMAVAWEEDSVGEGQGAGDVEAPDPHLRPSGPLDARYRIEPSSTTVDAPSSSSATRSRSTRRRSSSFWRRMEKPSWSTTGRRMVSSWSIGCLIAPNCAWADEGPRWCGSIALGEKGDDRLQPP